MKFLYNRVYLSAKLCQCVHTCATVAEQLSGNCVVFVLFACDKRQSLRHKT